MVTPLFSLFRGRFEEIRVFGEVIIVSDAGVIYQSSEAPGVYPARSLLKPFQFYATGLEDWMAERDCRYAPSLGSISATKEQVASLRVWNSNPPYCDLISKLKLPAAFPMDEEHRSVLKSTGRDPEPIYHPCFSKHMAIVEACHSYGWDLGTYPTFEHPFHLKLLESLSEILGEDLNHIESVRDGCGLPSPGLSLRRIATLYQKLGVARRSSSLYPIQQLMLKNPGWIGGPGRCDTLVMEENAGLIAKEGADGLFAMAILPTSNFSKGLGVVFKLSGGYSPEYYRMILVPLLSKLGLKPPSLLLKEHRISYWIQPFENTSAKIIDISPSLSEDTAVFPGDAGFKRKISLDMEKGDPLTLSSWEGTLHLGAHVDGPIHFEKGGAGIDGVCLEKYFGPCQVIEVKRSGAVVPKDLEGIEILSTRVLFKTCSFSDPNRFDPSFSCLSPELIQWLGKKGVFLVGIDTPSIDPSASKNLAAHRATIPYRMAILEQIVLNGVEDGIYELIALPLKIKDGDASPVRAVLVAGPDTVAGLRGDDDGLIPDIPV